MIKIYKITMKMKKLFIRIQLVENQVKFN